MDTYLMATLIAVSIIAAIAVVHYIHLFGENGDLKNDLEDWENRYGRLENEAAGLSMSIEAMDAAALEDANEIDYLQDALDKAKNRVEVFKSDVAPTMVGEFSGLLLVAAKSIENLQKKYEVAARSVQFGIEIEEELREQLAQAQQTIAQLQHETPRKAKR